jgi:predicted DsbA family dithiol-disulfide isomerase
MARAAYQLALESPHITAEVVEISEFPELAQRYNVRAVPLTIIGDRLAIPGAVPEATLVEQVMKVAEGDSLSELTQEEGPTTATPAQEPPSQGRGSGIIIP